MGLIFSLQRGICQVNAVTVHLEYSIQDDFNLPYRLEFFYNENR